MLVGHRSVVRVAVVGDEGTGKTSLISTAAHDAFDQRPPPVIPPTRLPAEFSSERVPMLLTDTSSRPEDAAATDLVLQNSDVVVICFDPRRFSTLDNIRTIWYPRVQRLKEEVPVVLACCKIDLLPDHEHERALLRERVERAVQDLPNVEVCLNCSAATLRTVADVFYYALKSVLYPLQPLYDRVERRLRPLCVRALQRAFIMCDIDKDGALSDPELNNFQLMCFNMPLTEEELHNVKQMVSSRMPNGVVGQGLTLEGFLFLHVLFIERGRLESTWAVLRKFGYNDELRLSDEVLDTINWKLPPDQVYELSDVAIDFLCRTFAIFDEDNDGLLTFQQMDTMFSTIPPPYWQGDAWHRLLVPGVYGAAHRLEAFLLKWRYSTLLDPRTAVAHLLYLGCSGPSGSGAQLLLTRCVQRRPDKRHDMLQRSVLQCYLFGADGVGKSSLVKALAGRSDVQLSGPLTAVGPVQCTDRERTLVLCEVPEEPLREFVKAQAAAAAAAATKPLVAPTPTVDKPAGFPDLARCSVAAFAFDVSNPESFQLALAAMEAVSTVAGNTLPCVLVAMKADLGMTQALEREVARACTELRIPLPLDVSTESGQLTDVFKQLVTAALHAEGHIPDTPARKAHKRTVRLMLLGAAAATTAAASAYLLYRMTLVPPPESQPTAVQDAAGSTSRPVSGLPSTSAPTTGSSSTHAAYTMPATLASNNQPTSSGRLSHAFNFDSSSSSSSSSPSVSPPPPLSNAPALPNAPPQVQQAHSDAESASPWSALLLNFEAMGAAVAVAGAMLARMVFGGDDESS